MHIPFTLRRALPLAVFPLLAQLGACALNGTVGTDTTPLTRSASRYLLTGAELQSVGGANTLDALRRLRPEFLAHRAFAATDDPFGGVPVLYVNGVAEGAMSLLSNLPLDAVREIRFLSAVEGAHKMGTYYPGGILSVTTRK